MAVPLTRDYYAVLGVPRDADRERLRKAYRALAAELHPDVSDDPDAAERFRALVEAYEVLSHPEARRRYDRTPGSSYGLFDDLFDGRGTRSQRAGERGDDVRVDAALDAVDAARGTTRGLAYSAVAVCAPCEGTGAVAGGRRLRCGDCGGSGRIREVGSADRGRLIRFRECTGCRGSGSIVDKPCESCGGEGRIDDERTIVVTIPPGSRDGDQVVLEGHGHAGGQGGSPGNVVVTLLVHETPDAPLLRHLAAAGAVCGVLLLVLTLVLQ